MGAIVAPRLRLTPLQFRKLAGTLTIRGAHRPRIEAFESTAPGRNGRGFFCPWALASRSMRRSQRRRTTRRSLRSSIGRARAAQLRRESNIIPPHLSAIINSQAPILPPSPAPAIPFSPRCKAGAVFFLGRARRRDDARSCDGPILEPQAGEPMARDRREARAWSVMNARGLSSRGRIRLH